MAQYSSIVITGMGFVTPLGHKLGTVTEAMRRGESGIRPVTLDDILPILMGRVSTEEFPRHGGDMAVDYALSATQDAWASSGLSDPDPWRVATIVGSSKGRLANLLGSGANLHCRQFDPNTFPGNTLGLALATRLRVSGPILNYPAACATGIVCMIRAAQSLQHDESDVALAGSGEASGKALVMASFHNMGALGTAPMRPFDRRRAGFNPGEGAAVFVMERETDAVARGARILARIVGWDQRSDAYHITSADPEATTVVHSIKKTLAMAGWEPSDVEYINAHGTGTLLNDLVEGKAIRDTFGVSTPLVSSIKPYVGHLLGASSAVELALSIAALRDSFIPPTLGLEEPDPDIPLNFVSRNGNFQTVHRFLKLSLGFGGHIGVVAVEIPT